jgi:hypothetical protein
MRQKVHALFGYRMDEGESFTAYLSKMDSYGQLDLLKVLKIVGMMLDEMERTDMAIKDLAGQFDEFHLTGKPIATKKHPQG